VTDLSFIELFWKFLPAALLVPFITFFLGRLGNNLDKKLEYRTFLDVAELTANYKLKNMPNIKNGTKLIIPNEFSSLEKEIDSRIKNNTIMPAKAQLVYLKVKSFGKSIITSGSVSITIRSVDKQDSWNLDISLPILEVNEEVYIPMDRFDKYEVEFYIEQILIKYRTQSGEKMLYKSTRRKNDNFETVVKNSISVKKLNLYYYAIDKNNGRNAGWIFLNTEKDKV
jgi:hypothetical protein